MDEIQREFLAVLNRFPYDLLVDLLVRTLTDKGISLNTSQRATLRAELERHNWSNLEFRLTTDGKNRTIVLDIADVDLSRIETHFDRVVRSLPETIESTTDEIASRTYRVLDRKWRAEQRRQRRDRTQFSRRLYRRWQEPLGQLERLIVVVSEVSAIVNHRLRQQRSQSKPFAVEVQTRLHARACQIAREVLTLLSAGFADGAMARWRALHEVAVVSLFIGSDEDLAERYRLHEAPESLRAARQYKHHTDRLGLEPLEEEEIVMLERDVARLNDRFGCGYSTDYGWAAKRLRRPGGKVTFGQIEEAAQLGHFRPYYRFASHNVHANPKGVFFRLGLIEQFGTLLAGASNYGLADPGQNTAISLGQATTALASLEPTLDDIVALKVVLLMMDQIPESFARVQRDIEDEEEEAETGSTA